MPPIRFSAFKYCALLTTFISLNGEIISPCSCYIKKGLVYIAIMEPFSRQLFFYIKYIKLNMHLSYDIRLVFNAKYAYLIYF